MTNKILFPDFGPKRATAQRGSASSQGTSVVASIQEARRSAQASPELRWLQVRAPRLPLEALGCEATISALHATGEDLVLEIRASRNAVEFGIRCYAQQAEEIGRAIWGVAPGWELAHCEPQPPPANSNRLVALMERPGVPSWAPLRVLNNSNRLDPLAAILEAVQPLTDGGQLLVRYLARPARLETRNKAQQALTIPAPALGLADMVSRLFDEGSRLPRFEAKLQQALEQRLGEPAFELIGAVALAGWDRGRLESRARSLERVFFSQFDAGFGGIRLSSWCREARPDNLPASWRPGKTVLYTTAGELATLWHPASEQVFVPGIAYSKRPFVALPPYLEQAQGLLLGTHRQRGIEVPVHLPRPDLEAGHAAVLGRTGVGKSTLVHQMLRQLIASPDHPAVGLIDPHSDLTLDIVSSSIPPEREKDVVLADLGDVDFPIGLPLFWGPPEVPRDILIQNSFSILRLIFREQWSPTRMEDAVFALAATLCGMPNATLLDVPKLLGDPGFRHRAISGLDDPVALEFWQDYEQMSQAAQREMGRPVLYRLRALYRSKAVRNLLCQTKGLDFQTRLEERKIILVSLAGQGIQAEADLLGELIIARFHLAALARLGRPKGERHPFYLAVDESQRFRGASLPVLLSEGRKLGLCLILSTQFLDSWGELLSESVLGNVGTLASFRCGPADSRRLAASLKPFTPDQLEDLDRYEAIVKLQISGTTMPAFDIKTLPLNTQKDEDALDRIRQYTRQNYARPRQEVEAEIDQSASSPSNGWDRHDVDED